MPRVLVLYNEPVLPPGHPDYESEHEVLGTVDIVIGHLAAAGMEAARLGVNTDPQRLWAALQEHRPDVVFNLFEGTADQGDTEAYVAGLLEWAGVPFTGCPFRTLCIARSKPLTKHLLQGAGIPTPAFITVDALQVPECRLEWPMIVKPAHEDASVGLDQGSVVSDPDRLTERVARLLCEYGGAVLIEEFIRGRELNVALVEAPELRALPVSEVLFTEKDPAYWPIVTYDAKWKPGSRDYEATPARYPADVAPRLAARLEEVARRAFGLLGCQDYARFDFRVRPSGKPFLLEVNPNPDYHPTAGLARGLTAAGIAHAEFTATLVRNAIRRGPRARASLPSVKGPAGS